MTLCECEHLCTYDAECKYYQVPTGSIVNPEDCQLFKATDSISAEDFQAVPNEDYSHLCFSAEPETQSPTPAPSSSPTLYPTPSPTPDHPCTSGNHNCDATHGVCMSGEDGAADSNSIRYQTTADGHSYHCACAAGYDFTNPLDASDNDCTPVYCSETTHADFSVTGLTQFCPNNWYKIESSGYDDGNNCLFYINGVNYPHPELYRGMNLLLMDGDTVTESVNFDTHGDSSKSDALTEWIYDQAPGSTILLGVQDAAADNLGDDAQEAIEYLGGHFFASSDLQLRESYALVGQVPIQYTGGTASMSSIYSNSALADRGNDGSTNNYLAHTLGGVGETSPWWQLKLDSRQVVARIKLYDRADRCASRIMSGWGCASSYWSGTYDGASQGATFGVSDQSCSGDNCYGTQCYRLTQMESSYIYTMDCEEDIEGEYVWYQLPGANRMINFRELQVFVRTFKATETHVARYGGVATVNGYAPMYTKHDGFCLDSNGDDQNTGSNSLADTGSGWDEQRCLLECMAQGAGAVGCEYHTGGACAWHSNAVSGGSGDSAYSCYNFRSAQGASCEVGCDDGGINSRSLTCNDGTWTGGTC